jgi:hypothetical protein
MRNHGLGVRLGIGTDIKYFFVGLPWLGQRPKIESLIERMLSFPAEQSRRSGAVALASESFSKLEQTGIVAQNFWPCGKLRKGFFRRFVISTPEKFSVKYSIYKLSRARCKPAIRAKLSPTVSALRDLSAVIGVTGRGLVALLFRAIPRDDGLPARALVIYTHRSSYRHLSLTD